MVKAWFKTYDFPGIITTCSNNFGPRQHAEKFIPTVVRNALADAPIPVYGDGSNIRDWLFVTDHARGLLRALDSGRIGETYCLGGSNEIKNVDLVGSICEILDSIASRLDGKSHADNISFVSDRPGHDWRYAIDSSKARTELGFAPEEPFRDSLDRTVRWLASMQIEQTERVNAD